MLMPAGRRRKNHQVSTLPNRLARAKKAKRRSSNSAANCSYLKMGQTKSRVLVSSSSSALPVARNGNGVS